MKDDIFSCMLGISEMLNNGSQYRATALTDEINGYTVDTCDTPDQGYETGICKGDGSWIISERYDDSESAKVGHAKWCEFVKTSPVEVYSVQLEETVEF